jgi:hypothetical protein
MHELPILALQARDLVERQLAAADRPRGPAGARAGERTRARRAPAAPLRTGGARLLRALADRLEPRADAQPRSA